MPYESMRAFMHLTYYYFHPIGDFKIIFICFLLSKALLLMPNTN